MAENDKGLPVVDDYFIADKKGKNPSTPGSSMNLDLAALPGDVSALFNQLHAKFSEIHREREALKEENGTLRAALQQRDRTENSADVINPPREGIEADAAPTTAYDKPTGVREESGMVSNVPKTDQEVFFKIGEEETLNPGSMATSATIVGARVKGNQAVPGDRTGGASSKPPPSQTARPTSLPGSDDLEVKIVQMEHIDFLAQHLEVSKWLTYIRILGVTDPEIDRIKHDHQGDIYEQKYQSLNSWRKQEGTFATPDRLIQTLIKRKDRLLAEKFCEQFPEYKYLLTVDAGRRGMKHSNSASPLSSPGQETTSHLTHSMSSMQIKPAGESPYATFTGLKNDAGNPTPSGDKPGMESVATHSGHHSFQGSKRDEAVPSCPPAYMTGQQNTNHTLGQSQSATATPRSANQHTQLAVILGPHMNRESELQRLQTQLLAFRGFTTRVRQSFQDCLLKYQTDLLFQQKIKEGLRQKVSMLEVMEFWASCLISVDINISGSPPHFLWNLFLALRETSHLRGLHNLLKGFLKPGSVGPSRPYSESLSDTKWSLINAVSQKLELKITGAPDWRRMAEDLGQSSHIDRWEQRNEGGESVINLYKTRGKTVGDLYLWMVQNNRNDIVECMEDLRFLL